MKAVSNILQRSERQEDLDKLVNTFVDVGILPQLDNLNNQIVYGRRGTGKTHVVKVLAKILQENDQFTSVYIDCRTLGSTSQFSDPNIPMKQRCISLFRDVLGEIHSGLLDFIINKSTGEPDVALNALDEFGKIITEPIRHYAEKIVSMRQLGKSGENYKLGVKSDSAIGLALEATGSNEQSLEREKSSSFNIIEEDKIIFSDLHATLDAVIKNADTTLFVLIDEWSSIPFDIQPYLAEFLKRSLMINASVVVKVAALEYRTNFGIRDGRDVFGFELGSDISTVLDIDDYYVYDRSPDLVTTYFAEILFKHLKCELPEKYLEDTYKVLSGQELHSKLFTQKSTFNELVRASEGVVRDLINIFTTAFFDSHRKGRRSIEHKSVIEAARQWFEKDKSQNLDDELQIALRLIVDHVIGTRKARSFLLPRELERHETIQRLFDSRVLHLMQRGYSDKANPGIRYNIYTLDYGTYVDLMNTSKEPQIELLELDEEVPDFVVPFDDKRSIRRIVLTRDNLGT